MFDDELQNEATSQRALNKYGPGGLAGDLNQQNLQTSNALFKMPHTFNGFGVNNYAKGGIVKGPGTGTSDSISAKLPVESAIIPAHIVKLYGKDYFDKLEAAAPKSSETKGKVDAKISNGEYQLSPEAVKYWGQDFITKLIGSDNEAAESNDSPGEEAAEMQHYAEGGVVKPGQPPAQPPQPTLFQKMFGTGTSPAPLDVLNGALSGKKPAEKPKGYRDGGIVSDQPPSLRDRALNTADSNAEFRQRNPDFGAKFAQDNAPAPSLSERVAASQANGIANDAGLRSRMDANLATQAQQAQSGLRDRAMNNAASNAEFRQRYPDFGSPQPQAPSLRERLGMPPGTEPIQRAPLGQAAAPSAQAIGGIRGVVNGAMQNMGGAPALATGLASTVLSDPAVAAGRDNAIAGLKQKAGIPADETPYKFAEGGIVKPEYADAGIPVLDNLANKVKSVGQGTIDAVAAPFNALRNASNVDPNAMRIQPKKADIADNQGFGAKPNALPQPVAQPELAAEQAKGLAKVATNPQPAPNPALAPKNQYDSALIPDGNRLQLTPEYNDYLNSKDTRTVAQRDASNATPEQITGQPAAGGLGARANDDYLTQRGKILEQNMEYNNQLAAMQANLAANGQPLIHQPLADTTVDPERNFGAKQRLAYDELAQNDRHANQTNALGRDELNQRIKQDNRKLDIEEGLKGTEHAAQPAWIDFFGEQTTPEQKTKLAGWLAKNDPKGWLAYQKKVNQ